MKHSYLSLTMSKIVKQYERAGVRLRATIESNDLQTHSRMQELTELDIDIIKDSLEEALDLTATYIISREEKKNA